MASIPMDQADSRNGGKPPVSAHPAFPAIVALWFAALFGLGSLILPVQLVERVVSMTGIVALVPAAAPPLGFTARAAIALFATISGALLGYLAARRMGRPKSQSLAIEAHDCERLPLNPDTDLDDDGIEVELLANKEEQSRDTKAKRVAGRRRPLAIEEENGPSDFLNIAPLPGDNEDSFEAAGQADDALDLAIEDELIESDQAHADAETSERQEFIPIDKAQSDVSSLESEDEDVTEDEASNLDEPLPFSPPSLSRCRAEDAPRPFDVPAQENEAVVDDDSKADEDCVSEQETCEAPEVSDDTKMTDETEGLVQLVQKLGDTIRKHREWSAERAANADAPPVAEVEDGTRSATPVPQDFDPAEAEEAAQAMASFFARADAKSEASDADDPQAIADDTDHPSNPAPVAGEAYAPFAGAMRVTEDVDDLEEEDDVADLAASFSLPLGSETVRATPTPRASFDIAAPTTPNAHSTSEAAADGDADGKSRGQVRDADYGSLSAVDNPFKNNGETFVRIDEPEPEPHATQPAVQFPSEQARKSAASPTAGGSNGAAGPRPFDPPAEVSASNETAEAATRRSASNDDNERALREALINLQRMSK